MTVIRFADVAVDVEAREVWRDGVAVEVQPQVFDVLMWLIENRSRVVSKEELLDKVWEHRFVTESALTSRIKSARRAIGDNGRDQRMIRTVHGRGYRFVATIEDDQTTGITAAAGELDEMGAAASAPARPIGLPSAVTPFIGRESELGIVEELLEDPTTRLVTILGPGGMGKTRLAMAAAERSVRAFPDGVFFVPLAPVTEPDRVVDVVAESLGVALDARVEPIQPLRSFLRSKHVLLVLDNLEHLQPTDLVAELLEAAPGLRILTTSRERLDMRAERVLQLDGMGWSKADDELAPVGGDAVELFIRTARSAKVSLRFDERSRERIGRICELVGGMPLAIELAAGWSDVLSVDEVAAEIERGIEVLDTAIRDVPKRHRSIRAVFDSSWERLTEDERQVFMKLSVFRGGFTRDDAEALAGATLPILRRLVATSMVSTSDETRHTVHELLRQYGEEALSSAGLLSEARRRHSDHYLGFVADSAPSLKGRDQLTAVQEIATELGNIRAAWSDAASRGGAGTMEPAIEGLWLFFDIRGNAGAMAPMIDEAAAALGTANDDQADGLTPIMQAARGVVSAERGSLDNGRRSLEAALSRLDTGDTLGDDVTRARAALGHLWLGWVDFLLARNSDAEEHGRRGLELYEAIGDQWGVARCQYLLGNNDTALGRLTIAQDLLASGCAAADSIGDERGAALARRNLSILAGWFGEYEEARALLDDVIATTTEYGDRLGLAYGLRELGKIELAEGNATQAVSTLSRSISITDELENRWESAVTHDDLGNAFAELGELESARESLQLCLQAATDNANRYYVARCTGDLGALAAREGDAERARQHLDEARAMWEEIGHEPYLTWTVVQLGHLATSEAEAARLFAAAITMAVRNGLAPFALDAVVGAARLGLPDEIEARSSNLRFVSGHPSATAAVRSQAERVLGELGDIPSGSGQPPDRSDADGWRETAGSVARRLEEMLEHSGS